MRRADACQRNRNAPGGLVDGYGLASEESSRSPPPPPAGRGIGRAPMKTCSQGLPIPKHLRRKRLNRRTLLPCSRVQTGLAASLFEKSDAIPSMFHRHLGQKQATTAILADEQPMTS